ncbi:hypothetical protein K435DRAFT_312355 [Dendrothele bispora CBS 962.96]|uniref:Crinkler effector protein N-terminal domain-containing protein n=1 Tax=Dendrothele bispora (strain CBS 962.96) TaxID=1314807 RepID=A0A4S8LHB6_DENBC|nr:hypothetical protein K435DRAFT_312355 [Dendrothele bispora CBS 962.96]
MKHDREAQIPRADENRPPSPFLVTLFCYVVGSKTPFSVAISSSLTVDHLKKMIQQERPNLLKGIDPADLELFNVSLPSGRDLVEQVKDAVEVAEPLDPTTDIIEIFPDDSPKKIIHIAVRLPHDADFQFSKMHPSPYVYKHPLLQTVKPGSVPQDLQHLYELAWKNRNRESLFQLVSANNDSSPGGFQYESLISTEDFDELPMAKYGILITPEYKAALSDAKRWFSGGKVSPTASDTKNVLKPNERQDDEGESGTGEDGTGEDGTGEDGTGEDGTGEDKGKDKDDVETGLPEEDWPADRTFDRRFFIVVGTPGIGKSLCLYYILVERLLARLPTCFQTVPGFFTF